VNELQAFAADLVGKEAALLVPTGTVANLVALMSSTTPGDQIVAEASSHVLWSEEWGYAAVCALVPRPICGTLGRLDPAHVLAAMKDARMGHRARTALIWVENTHSMAGGTVVTPSQMAALARVAAESGVSIHVDGARLFNAAVALGTEPRLLAADAETLTFSLTKGLSAPMGAILCGPKDFIERSRVNLKRLGGWSVHKAGIYAAAGLVALRTMLPRLAEDNRRARLLGDGLAALKSIPIRVAPVETNIVMVSVDAAWMSGQAVLERLHAHGVRGSLRAADTIRFVTHRHMSDDDVYRVVAAFEKLAAFG
jgi:threonine aldolase